MKRRSILKGILGALFAPVLPKIPAEALAPIVEAPVPPAALFGLQVESGFITEGYVLSSYVRTPGMPWRRVAKSFTKDEVAEHGGVMALSINPHGKLGVDWDSEMIVGPHPGPETPEMFNRRLTVSRASTAYYWAEEDMSQEERALAGKEYRKALSEAIAERRALVWSECDDEAKTHARLAKQYLAYAMRYRKLWLHGEKRRYLRRSPTLFEPGRQNLVLKSNEFTPEKWS